MSNAMLDKIVMAARDVLVVGFFLVCIIFIISAILASRKQGPKLIKRLFMIFWINMGLLFLYFLLCAIFETNVRNEFRHFLEVNKENRVVKIDKKCIDDVDMVWAELSKIKPIFAHHSHVTEKIAIDLFVDHERVSIQLGKDSQVNNEYWVFWPKYRYTKTNEIGRLRTNYFNKYFTQ